MDLRRRSRPALRPLAALLCGLLPLGLSSCGGKDGPDPALVVARDQAADFGRLEQWTKAREVLAPFVARDGAAGEDLLRAAFAELANDSEVDRVQLATPLVERAAKAGADPDRLLWARYRLEAADYDSEAAVPLLRELARLRPDDFVVALALAVTLDEVGGAENEDEARAVLRELIAIPQELTGAWHAMMLFRLANSLQGEGRTEEAKPLFEAFEALEARAVKSPGPPAHQPGTLGQIEPHTPRTSPIEPPSAPTPRLTPREIARGEITDVHAVELAWGARDGARGPYVGGQPDVGPAFGAPPEELYELGASPVLLTAAQGGIALVRGAIAPEPLHDGAVLDLVPFDRKNVGAVKSAEPEKDRKVGDQDLDALYAAPAGSGVELHLLENVGGTWTPGPAELGVLATLPPLAGPDSLVDVDFDHDGDVDLLVTTEAGPRLLRNDGLDQTGGFTDVTAEAGLPASGAFRATFEDLDRDNDVDLLLVERASGVPRLFSNERGGRFSDATATLPAGLRGGWIVLADLDGDSWVDLAHVSDDVAIHLRAETGVWRAEPRRLPLPAPPTGEPIAVDWDGDGAFDLLWPTAATPAAGLLAPGYEAGGVPFTAGEPFASPRPAPARLLATDLDADLDLDLVRLDESGLVAHLREGAGGATALRLIGHKDNARGIGAIIEARSGLAYRRLYYRGGTELVAFGGKPLDAVRVTWPNGVVQTEFGLPTGRSYLIAQRLGQVGSCPFLYTWNGTTYEFVSDVLGITPLGLPMGPGMLVPPDHDEYVLVRGEQLVPKDGVYELHLTEELREVTYLDRIRLDVVDHPIGTEVFPNERFTFPPFPAAHTHTVKDPLVPLSAVDQDGRDWTEELARDDRTFAIPFEALPGPYRGLATDHVLELAFDPERVKDAPKLRLFLNGWFYWTDASVNMAAAHHPDVEFVPPLLSVPDGTGGWEDHGPIGFPAGKLKTMVVDVTELVNRDDPRLRLTSTLRLYWDSIRLAVDADDAPLVTTPLEPTSARLWERGFSRSFPLLGAHDCEWFTWDELESPRWNQHPGMYTKLGETLPLVTAIDDRFVILGAGDALTVRFDATGVPPLPEGWRRDYLVFLDGWAKDRDPNTVEALYVEPLPFHGMSGYPYGPDERFPDGELHRAWRREWNTRPARRWIEPLVSPSLPVPARGPSATSAMPASSAEAAPATGAVIRSPSKATPAAPATSG